MRKMVFGRKLSRGKKSREALFRALIRGMVLDGKIVTTTAKAKAIRGQIDKIVTLAKKGTLATRRRALAYLANDRASTAKLFGPIAKAFAQRKGGYTRMVSLPRRRGDSAKMVRIEWSDEIVVEKTEVKEKSVKKEAKKEDLVKVRNLGEKSLKIISAALGQKGIIWEGWK